MKKLLSLLFILPVSVAAVTPVLSYSTSPQKSVNKEAEFYAQISAEAIKSAILNDQDEIINNKLAHIGTKFSADYYGNKKIGDTFSNLFNKNQGASFDPSDPVYLIYDSVFGHNSSGYKITSAFKELKDDGAVRKNTHLWDVVHGNAGSDVEPDKNNTANLISGASAIAQMVFGTDFSTGMASTITSILTSTTVQNAIKGKDVKSIFANIDDILSSNSDSIVKVLKALTQSDVSTDVTFGDQLTNATNQLFRGLIYIVSDGTYTYQNINDAPSVFWGFLLNDENAKKALTPTTKSTENLISSIADIIPFGMSLIQYFRTFDNNKVRNISNPRHLFSTAKTNTEVKAEILKQKYIPNNKTDDYWYFDGQTHYMKFNLQNLFSDLMMYLSPSNSGYQSLKAINILLGGVATESGNTVDLNPIVKAAVQPLLNIASGKITSVLDQAATGPLEAPVKNLEKQIQQLLTTTVSQLMEWISTDGHTNFSNVKTILETIKTLANIIEKINIDQSSLSDSQKKSVAIVYSIADFFTSSSVEDFINHPWSSFYNGSLLSDIGNVRLLSRGSENDRKIGYALKQMSNFQNIIGSMSIKDLITNISLIASGSLASIPDWIYKVKDYTIASLLKAYVPSLYKTSGSKNLSQNSEFAISSEALTNVISSLSPNIDGKNANQIDVTLTKADKTIHVSPLMAIYYGIVYNGNTKSLEGDEDFGTYKIKLPGSQEFIPIITSQPSKDNPDNLATSVSPDAFNYLFGVGKKNGKVVFSEGSLFYAMSQLYGHNYADNLEHPEMAKGLISIFNILVKFGDFANNSVQEVIKDSYSKYLSPDLWSVKNITEKGLDKTKENVEQTIDYDIYYRNPDKSKRSPYVYHIKLSRIPAGNDSGFWKVKQIYLTN